MKKLLIVSLLVMLAAGICYGVDTLTPFNNVSKYTVSTAAPVGKAFKVSGPILLKSNAMACSVFLNATTLARTQASTGFPLTANTEVRIDIPKTSNLTFTCATSAGDRSVYIVR